MLSRGRALRVVAAVTAVVLVGLSVSALVSSGGAEQDAPGLTKDFQRLDSNYQSATRDFVVQAKDLDQADLRTTLRLFGLVLDAAQDARAALGELDVVTETARPTDRMQRALEVQELALEQAIASARDRDPAGTSQAAQQFQTAVLAYQVAREAMVSALARCGERCA